MKKDSFSERRCEAAASIRQPLRSSAEQLTGGSFQRLKSTIGLKQIIGESEPFLAQLERVSRFAQSDASVVIHGESGTGKELFARALHYLSRRAGNAFVPLNCGALPEHLVESEIFGHRRGAFTGATFDQDGLVSEADGGTLFLDEVDALPLPAQVKLLRLLQDGEYRAVGSKKIAYASIRVIAAANRDFETLLRTGKFREDLFYRLNVLPLHLPPLRERPGDIVLLAEHILSDLATRSPAPPKHLSLAALNALLAHSWPGNVRELQNVLTRGAVLCDGDTIELAHLGFPEESMREAESFQGIKTRVIARFEHDFLQSLLRSHHGNITQAAGAVKKNRRAFWELLRKHGLLGDPDGKGERRDSPA